MGKDKVKPSLGIIGVDIMGGVSYIYTHTRTHLRWLSLSLHSCKRQKSHAILPFASGMASDPMPWQVEFGSFQKDGSM